MDDQETQRPLKRPLPNGEGVEQRRTKPRPVRKRAAMACEECRARKRRCDEVMPVCGACTKQKTHCEYYQRMQTLKWRDNILQSLKQHLEQMEGPVRADRLENALFPAGIHAGQPSDGSEVSMSRSQQLEHATQGVPEARYPFNSSSVSAQRAQQHSPLTHSRPSTQVEWRLEQAESNKAPARAMSECADAHLMSPAASDASHQLERMMEPIISHIGQDKARMSHTQVEQRGECRCDIALDPGEDCSLPLRRSADAMVNRFFSRHNPVFPIFHEKSFRKQYESIWSAEHTVCCGLCRQPSRGKLFLPTIYAILATVWLMEDDYPGKNAAKAESFMVKAQRFDLFTVLEAEVGVELVQLLLLICRYLASTERIAKYKSMTGIVIRLAQQIGLHLDVSDARTARLLPRPATQLDCELRKRVWCACVSLERDIPLYLSSGRPLVVTPSERLTLAELIDDSLLNETVGRTNQQLGGTTSSLASFVETVKLYDVVVEVLSPGYRDMNSAQDIATALSSVLRLHSRLSAWRHGLPQQLKFDLLATSVSTTNDYSNYGFDQGSSVLTMHAKKLMMRFLNAEQLILRPALELCFRRSHTRTAPREESIETAILTKCAVECVSSAARTIELLSTGDTLRTFPAWWFNIAFLHTSGSTILMALAALPLDGASLKPDLMESWEKCVATLGEYAKFSSIAERSASLLQQSANRLQHSRPLSGTRFSSSANCTADGEQQHEGESQEAALEQSRAGRINVVYEQPVACPLASVRSSQVAAQPSTPTKTARVDWEMSNFPPDLDDHFWDNDDQFFDSSLLQSDDRMVSFPRETEALL